jgi:hypothetical protein
LLGLARARRAGAQSRSRWPTPCARRWRRRGEDAPPKPRFERIEERLAYLRWLGDASERLKRRKAEHQTRVEFLETVWYESRAPGWRPRWCWA